MKRHSILLVLVDLEGTLWIIHLLVLINTQKTRVINLDKGQTSHCGAPSTIALLNKLRDVHDTLRKINFRVIGLM